MERSTPRAPARTPTRSPRPAPTDRRRARASPTRSSGHRRYLAGVGGTAGQTGTPGAGVVGPTIRVAKTACNGADAGSLERRSRRSRQRLGRNTKRCKYVRPLGVSCGGLALRPERRPMPVSPPRAPLARTRSGAKANSVLCGASALSERDGACDARGRAVHRPRGTVRPPPPRAGRHAPPLTRRCARTGPLLLCPGSASPAHRPHSATGLSGVHECDAEAPIRRPLPYHAAPGPRRVADSATRRQRRPSLSDARPLPRPASPARRLRASPWPRSQHV